MSSSFSSLSSWYNWCPLDFHPHHQEALIEIIIIVFFIITRFSLNPGDYLERRSTWKLILFFAAAALILLLLITVSLRSRKMLAPTFLYSSFLFQESRCNCDWTDWGGKHCLWADDNNSFLSPSPISLPGDPSSCCCFIVCSVAASLAEERYFCRLWS